METFFQASPIPDAWFVHKGRSTIWSKEENKLFESALAVFDEKTPNRWYKVACMIPGKSVYDVMNQYRELEADVCDIEAGLVPIPGYLASPFAFESDDNLDFESYRKKGRSRDQERRKGVPWTEEEHRRFLMGLQKYGKGDWRNISRDAVISKTPTQVASHAQKYFLRQLSGCKDKRRPSIHDIHLDISQEDDVKSCFPVKSNELLSLQKPISTPKTPVDWTQYQYQHDIATKGRYVVTIGGYDPSFLLQTQRFRG